MTVTQQPEHFAATAQEIPEAPRGPRAGFWRRFAASLLDALLITTCSLPLIVIDVTLYKVVNLLAQAVYYTLLEGGPRGQTIGKRALGIRVVSLSNGEPIGYARGLIRYIGRYPSFFVFLIGYLRMLWHADRQTWHDKMAGAVVVR
jgi:uncharacterized RDD family membrane protein YckC